MAKLFLPVLLALLGATLISLHGNGEAPAWSPDGTQIAFWRLEDDRYALYQMNTDGGALVKLADQLTYESAPVWSPDGSMYSEQTKWPEGFDYVSAGAILVEV